MFTSPSIADLKTESDVEQKLIFPLLTADLPYGLGIPSSLILTKLSIRRLSIGKGTEAKLYFPDYIIMSNGIPVAIIEAKKTGENLEEAYREARLYAHEINAKYPQGINPVKYIVSCNGEFLMFGTVDTDKGKILKLEELNTAHQIFSELQDCLGKPNLDTYSKSINITTKPTRYWKAKKLLGGSTVQGEEVGKNTFGLALSAKFGRIFAPETTADRSVIAREAYVDSKSAHRALLPIDRIIRAARPLSETKPQTIEDRSQPKELFSALRSGNSNLEQKILLLIGSVGSGKTTFVDYLMYKALPKDILDATLWCRIDMNAAPISGADIYKWLRIRISQSCTDHYPDEDFESLEVLKKIYSVEFNKFEKAQGRILKETNNIAEYGKELSRKITIWEEDDEVRSKAITRYCCGDRGKLLIIVLDNCDKRSRDEQLLMFSAAQWIQQEYRSLIILPLREETFEVYQDQPPLDTAIKDLIFRIEAPHFQQVLVKRVQLALSKMKGDEDKTAHFELPNGFRVECPNTDQAFYLAAIIRSLFEHDRYIRRMITGLSGRNIRKALEIFIDFCNSAHLGEDEIFKIRQAEGKYTLPLYLVIRILLRGNLRYYDGQNSVVKNLFDIYHQDDEPSYFCRLIILNWLQVRFNQKGANGVRGYFRVADLKSSLTLLGIPDYIIDRELDTLHKAQCITSESLNSSILEKTDLVRISAAGYVHLELLESIDYLATIAEDTWFDNISIAKRISERIQRIEKHYHRYTQLDNARDIVNYLEGKQKISQELIGSFVALDAGITSLWSLEKAKKAVSEIENSAKHDEWFDLDKQYPKGTTTQGKVVNRTEKHGLFVEINSSITGLIHKSKLPENYLKDPSFIPGETIECKVTNVDTVNKKISLSLL